MYKCDTITVKNVKFCSTHTDQVEASCKMESLRYNRLLSSSSCGTPLSCVCVKKIKTNLYEYMYNVIEDY